MESRARPYLLPLLLGNSHTIDRVAQLTLATWLTKTTMVAEFSYKADEVVIPQKQRLYLMEHQEPPPGWQVWIAPMQSVKYFVSIFHFGNFGATMSSVTQSSQIVSPQVTLIGLGGMFAHVFSTDSTTTWLDLRSEIGVPFTQIWPILDDRITWPNRRPISTMEIDRLVVTAARAFAVPFAVVDREEPRDG